MSHRLPGTGQSGEDALAERVARMEAVYRQLPVTVLAGTINAVLTAAVVAGASTGGDLAVWLAAVVITGGVRLIVWKLFWRPGQDHAAPRWAAVSWVGALVAGGLWGVLCATLVPPEQPYPTFVAFVMGGMCAGAATFNAPHIPTVIAFVLPSVLPLAAMFARQGDRFDVAMSVMSTLFALTLIVTAARYGRFFGQSIQTRLDLARRTEALSAANAKLRREVDERQAAEAALRHAQTMEAIGNLTAGVAHDFNNVLMAISGAADLLRPRFAETPKDAALIDAIAFATDRGSKLTRHLLAFARKEALDPAVVDPNTVLQTLSPLLSATLGKAVRIELAVQDGVWPVYVDRNELERAVVNLAINARDAMPDGGTVTLVTQNLTALPAQAALPTQVPGVAISVRDSGTGMPADVLRHAFEPFFTTKPVGRGSGLGLSQVYGLAQQSGGTTWIDSAPDAGTTVWIYLPRAGEQQIARHDPARTAVPLSVPATADGHVVVLDDEALIADLVSAMLRRAGYRVSTYSSEAQAAGRLAEDATVSLLLTDLDMPHRRGDDVAREARSRRQNLPVVFMTGYNNLARLGDEPWQLRKPFTEAELLETVRAALARAAV